MRKNYGKVWWWHDVETSSTLLAHNGGISWLNLESPHKKASDAELWSFFCSQSEQGADQTVMLPVIEDGITLIWRRGNISSMPPVYKVLEAWWRHPVEAFPALLAFLSGNSPVTGEFPAQMSGTRSFHIFFDLPLNNY